ncbi:pyridoxamine 5'-phosphate oxidase family protein [Nocardia arthritidis]|uniref:Pyridoxamine 5'-phosphate oxidase family protein n=1 Tax=Nocardia arthritidis TaxID=228602 RepID=A0A6G9YMB5_9NOCA|nr:pyridoxamine 5'-phosphate oxidase family protein [Nocardia arthritidis]QIS14445.1 pyridoxamine 5'-phosphate oxidase family protein [Nocardia arthritidis]
MPESLRWLAGAPFGRVVFTENALPAVRPMYHLVDDDRVVIHGQLGSVLPRGHEQVVTYAADEIDPTTRLGWLVTVTGLAGPVTDPAEIERYQSLLNRLIPLPHDQVIRISCEFVAGIELVSSTLPRAAD